jgi:hypothetical protein
MTQRVSNADRTHVRKCWDCDNIAAHIDACGLAVTCKQCGSWDTRRVTPAPANPGQRSPSEELAAIERQLAAWCERHRSEGQPFLAAGQLAAQAVEALGWAMRTLQKGKQ